jgi:ABC-type multidrug transport system fused ATPase/permease subunit
MRHFSLEQTLRPDVKAIGLESWLLSEVRKAFSGLGDTSIKPYWRNRAASGSSMVRNILREFISSAEYGWLMYEGLHKGISLGTLQLIRWSMDEMTEGLWDLSEAAETAATGWKNIIGYFRCLDLKPEIAKPEQPHEYQSGPAGMKIEARGIRYKYDEDDKEEVLKGASFVINPGEMIAVVGCNLVSI